MTGCQAKHNANEIEETDEVITFADSVIEAESRRILDKPEGDITTQDVLSITAFGVDEDGKSTVSDDITTLTYLKWFENLESISLSGCNINSLEGIESLINLKKIDVRRNNISSLAPVVNLVNLVDLDCADNKISDYSPLSTLTNLESLCIGDNEGSDISVLENLTRLKSLYAPWCGISDITVLGNMPDLEYLQLSFNNISDIDSLKNLKNIIYLYLGRNQISDISTIENFNKLEYIDLQDNPIPEGMLEKFYEPKDADYITTTINANINGDMPEFIFEVLAYFSRKTSDYAAQTLTITDSSTGEVIQTISLPILSMFGQTHIWPSYIETMGFELEDLNFEGYMDIRLYDTPNGNYRTEWIYLVWMPELGLFQEDSRLNQISLATFDQEEQLIYGMERGSAADHWYYTYEYIDGEPTLIRSYSENYIYNDSNLQAYLEAANINTEETDIAGFHEVVSERNEKTGEMEVKRDEYVLYPYAHMLNEDAIIARFDASSEIGKMISADN